MSQDYEQLLFAQVLTVVAFRVKEVMMFGEGEGVSKVINVYDEESKRVLMTVPYSPVYRHIFALYNWNFSLYYYYYFV